jgi:tetratricopeptide (TPR) repeat protein
MNIFILIMGIILLLTLILYLQDREEKREAKEVLPLKTLPPRTGGLEPIPETPDFVDREEELSSLEKAFKEGRSIILCGEEGVGKTSLVAQFIKERLPHSKNLFWFTCDEHTRTEDLLFSLNELLRQKGDPYFEPVLSNYQIGWREKIGLLEKRLTGKNLILFIDQVERVRDQRLLDLLRHLSQHLGGSRLCLITSGRPDELGIKSPLILELSGLGKEGARELLKREGLDVGDDVLEEFGTNPLALKLLMGLATLHHYPLEDVAKKRGEGWVWIFNEAIQMLREEERLLLHQLSAAREGLPVEGIRYLCRRIDLEDILSTLTTSNLLTKDGGFYSIHPMIRSLLYKNLVNRQEVHGALSRYYNDLYKINSSIRFNLEAIHHAILARDFELSSSLLLMDVKGMMRGGYATCILDYLSLHERGALPPRVWIRILGLKGDLYKSMGMLNEAKDSYEEMLKEARGIRSSQGMGHAYNGIGSIYQAKGRWKEAIEHYEKGLEILKEMDKAKREVSLPYIGWIYRGKGRWNEAIRYYLKYYENTLKANIESGDLIGQANSYTNLGGAYQAQGDWNRAIDYYTKSLEILRGFDDPLAEARCYNNLGSVYSARGDLDRAISYYEKGLEALQSIGDEVEDAKTLSNLGEVYREKEDYLRAIPYYEQSLDRLRAVGDVVGEAKCLVRLSNVLKEQGDLEKAAKYLTRAHHIYLQLEGHTMDPKTLNAMGLIYQKMGDHERALECFKWGIEESVKAGDLEAEMMLTNSLGSLLRELGRYEEAAQYLNRALEIGEAGGKIKDQILSHLHLGLLLKTKGDKKGAFSHYEAVRTLKEKVDPKEIGGEFEVLYSQLKIEEGGGTP